MLRSFSWRQLLHYGEVFGFAVAWAVGLLVALGGQTVTPSPAEPDSMQIVSTTKLPPVLVE